MTSGHQCIGTTTTVQLPFDLVRKHRGKLAPVFPAAPGKPTSSTHMCTLMWNERQYGLPTLAYLCPRYSTMLACYSLLILVSKATMQDG